LQASLQFNETKVRLERQFVRESSHFLAMEEKKRGSGGETGLKIVLNRVFGKKSKCDDEAQAFLSWHKRHVARHVALDLDGFTGASLFSWKSCQLLVRYFHSTK